MEREFGRVPSEFDEDDWNLRDFVPRGGGFLLNNQANWEFPLPPTNQEKTTHCCGFAGINFGINLPVHVPYTNKDGHKLYYQCKMIDCEPNSESGSSIRSVARALKHNFRIEGYAFAPDMGIIKYWLLNRGPMIVGTLWTTEMMTANADNIITIGGDVLGGHAYLLNEWRADDYIGIQNSWGTDWGVNGKAYISATDFEKLFIRDGEALAAVELDALASNKPCILVDIIKKIFNK